MPSAYRDGVAYGVNGGLDATVGQTGEVLWDLERRAAVTLYENKLIGVAEDHVVSVDVTTGKYLWEVKDPFNPATKYSSCYECREEVGSAPAVANDLVLAANYADEFNSYMYAFDVETGDLVWTFTAEGELGTPAVSGDTVVIGSADEHLYGVSLASGETLWDREFDDATDAVPAILGQRVFMTDYSRLHALDLVTGRDVWESRIDGCCLHSSVTIATNQVFLIAEDALVAFDIQTGERRWDVEVVDHGDGPEYPPLAPILADGKLYVGTHEAVLLTINQDSGEIITGVQFDAVYGMVIVDGMAFVQGSAGKVYALD